MLLSDSLLRIIKDLMGTHKYLSSMIYLVGKRSIYYNVIKEFENYKAINTYPS